MVDIQGFTTDPDRSASDGVPCTPTLLESSTPLQILHSFRIEYLAVKLQEKAQKEICGVTINQPAQSGLEVLMALQREYTSWPEPR